MLIEKLRQVKTTETMKAQTLIKSNNLKTSKKLMMKLKKTELQVLLPKLNKWIPAKMKLVFTPFNTRDSASSSLIFVFPGVNILTLKLTSSF